GADEHVLFVPEERDGAAQLMLVLAAIDRDRGPIAAACDHWEAYHGRTPLRTWAAAGIVAAKWGGQVVDGDELMRPDPLAPHLAGLCRSANADPSSLTEACRRHARVAVVDPVAVGADSGGIDVRAAFGVVRLEFDEAARTPEAAQRAIDRLLEGGGA